MFTSKKNNDFKEVTPRSVTKELDDNRPVKIWLTVYGWRYFILILTSLLCAVFLSPKSKESAIDLDDLRIGTIAKQDYKTQVEMTVVDEELTARKKEEARNNVRPCYNLDVTKGSQVTHQFTSSFALMHNEIAALRHELNDSNSEPALVDGQTEPPVKELIEPTYEQRQLRYLTKLEAFNRTLLYQLTEEQFKVFAANDFSPALQNLGTSALARLLPAGQPIIKNKFLASDKMPQGITILSNQIYQKDTPISVERLVDIDELKQGVPKLLEELNKDNLSPELVAIMDVVVENLLDVNITENTTETELRRARASELVPPSANSYSAGQIICRGGEPITREQHLALTQLSKLSEQNLPNTLQVGFGLFIAVFILIFICLQYWNDNFWKISLKSRDLALFSLLILLTVVLLFVCSWIGSTDKIASAGAEDVQLDTIFYLMPFASLVMTMRSILGRSKAMILTFIAAILTAFCFNGTSAIGYAIYLIVGSLVGAWYVAHTTERRYVFKSGIAVIISNVLMVLAISAYSYNSDGEFHFVQLLMNLLAAVVSGTLSSFCYTALIPMMESIFGYITDGRLLELGNLNHPLLRKLMVEAPGTYHHSVMVDLLAEAVAPAIGANPLKVRVMAYFHDVGKMKNPRYFAENQAGENPHENMKAIMSARVLKSHVTDGVKLAQEYKLGELVEAAIMQHHGTTRVGFYNKAKEMETPEDPVNESDYRYAGPIPQTKETALLMLADSVEAAVKSIKEPNRDRIMNMVTKIINGKFTDEQLNDCDLTLRDLHIIAKSFTDTLNGMNYSRPEYASTSQNPTKSRDINTKELKNNKDEAKENFRPSRGQTLEIKEEENANSDSKQTKRPESHLYNTADIGPEGIKHLGQI